MKPLADVVFETLGEEGILYKLSTETFFGLNATSARIWSLAERGADLEEISSILNREFDVSLEQARCDTMAFLGLLVARALAAPLPD